MAEPAPRPTTDPDPRAALDRSLRRSHRTVLAVIAACAVASALQPGSDESAAPDPNLTTLAVGLALAVIVLRRAATSRVVAARTRVMLTLCAYGTAAALAMLGTWAATTQGAMQTGLVYALAAAIFCLRPPQPIAARGTDEPSRRTP